MLPIEFTVSLTPADYGKIISARMRQGIIPRVIITGSWALAAITAGVVVFKLIALLVSSQPLAVPNEVAYLPALVCVPSYLIWYRPLMIRTTIARNPHLPKSVAFTLNEESVVIDNGSARSEFKWSHFKEVARVADAYCLVYANNPTNYEIIPLAAFESAEQETAFRNLVESKLGPIH